MQIRPIKENAYNNNTTFTSFYVPKSSQRRFMAALRESCNTKDLIIIRNEMLEQVRNKKKIILEDLGYYFGQPVNGHLSATINGKEYSNGSPFRASFWSYPKFISRLAKIADKAELKDTKSKVSDKTAKAAYNLFAKAKRLEIVSDTKKEVKRMLKLQKEGKVTAAEQNHYLLGEIYKLIQY